MAGSAGRPITRVAVSTRDSTAHTIVTTQRGANVVATLIRRPEVRLYLTATSLLFVELLLIR